MWMIKFKMRFATYPWKVEVGFGTETVMEDKFLLFVCNGK